MTQPTTSEHFCCRECGSDVALELSYGDELYYQCQNAACRKAVSVDCPEALAEKPAPVVPTTAAERKAAYHLARGLAIVATVNGWLVPSGSRSSVIHHVSTAGLCSCEAAQNGRQCWHVAAVARQEAA